MTLTGLVSLECFVGFMPKRFTVFLQFEEAVLLPGGRANLDQLPTDQQELEICISLQTYRSDRVGERNHDIVSINIEYIGFLKCSIYISHNAINSIFLRNTPWLHVVTQV